MSGKRSRDKSKNELTPRIRVYWSKTEKDLMVNWDAGCSSSTANYIICNFTKSFIDELEKRGYDVSTLRFQIRKKPYTEGKTK